MAVQEPAWLRRTRPCPFFSQGRCLFADSCNFLHDVKVRSAVSQPLLNTVHVEQPLLSPKLAFDLPSVLVYSASPVNFPASPQSPESSTKDSSRYSGLLSVLSDVIGPAEDAEPPSRATFPIPPNLPSGTDLVAPITIYGPEIPSLIPELDSEGTLADPSGAQRESFSSEDVEFIAEFPPVPADQKSVDGDSISYSAEATEAYVIDMDDCGEDLTAIPSNRQSILSSFTGVSLLASPQRCVSEEFSVASPVQDTAVVLLSPVQLSTKLRPFPVLSSGFNVKRGDSIDSGYADGDSWVGPVPFPRSPPGSSRSSGIFLPYPRRASLSSPAGRVSDHFLAPSSHSPVEEVESDGGAEDNDTAAYTILGAYSASSPEEQARVAASDPLQVYVTQEKVEEDLPLNASAVPAPRSESSYLDSATGTESQISSVGIRKERSSEECLLPEEVFIDLDMLLGSPEADALQGLTPDEVHSERQQQSHFDERSWISSSSVHPSHDLSSTKNAASCVLVGTSVLQRFASESRVSPRECPSGAFHFDVQSSRSSPLAEFYQGHLLIEDASSSSLDANRHQQVCSEDVPREHLPGVFHHDETVGHLTLSSEGDSFVLSDAGLEEGVSNPYAILQDGEIQQYMGPDLTEKARPSHLPLVGFPDSDTDSTLRRRRAASDLTVKGKSPPRITHGGMLVSPPQPQEQSGQSDSVQSLYDEYFDDGCSDNGCSDDGSVSLINNQVHENTAPDVFGSIEQPYLHLASHRVHSPSSNGEQGISTTDFPRSETILRPLLTRRSSYLHSSLSDLTPKDFLNEKELSSLNHPSTRLQAKEIGSTVVPLGFRRHKPQPAATQSLRRAWQPSHTELPASELREVLRIRTDITRHDSAPGCSSASHVSFTMRSPLPVKAMSAPPSGGLKQLCLSSIVNQRSSTLCTHSSSIASSILSIDHMSNSSAPQSPSVSSTTSFSHNSLLSSSCQQIPRQFQHTLERINSNTLIQQASDAYSMSQCSLTRPNSHSVSAPIQQPKSWRLSHYRAGSRNYTSVDSDRRLSRRASTLSLSCIVAEEQEIDEDAAISCSIQLKHADGWTPTSLAVPGHAIATPKPTLLFAIASDDVDQVRQVLESGEAGPNDSVGPQSALAFTLTNDKLAHKQEIVKALLAYGADPSALRNPTLNPAPRQGGGETNDQPPETTLEKMDPATRYFVARADAAHTRQTSQLIYRSIFRPLTRVRYDVIGQDWALEQLFRVLSMHSQKLAVTPIVVLLCGPSGHGKSLLARKFGYLLDVPTHTVNMTTLRSAHDIWQSYSMSPYEEPSSCTLAEFLIENEGKRCVVVLDEIEKVEDEKALWSLLMPWELGRCSLEAGKRHVDARNVIWLGTSNAGHEFVFEHHENRTERDKRMSREDYLELTGMLRPCVSRCLGASLVSRVTTVLPFVPFTLDEKKAIAAEAVYALAGDASKTFSPQDVESLVTQALPSYHPNEGARSLHRAISNILMDTI